MNKRLLPVFFGILLALAAFTQPAGALVIGPIANNGFPAWIGDGADAANPGLQLMPCLKPGNHNAGIGPCLAGPGEVPFWAAEIIPATPPAPLTELRIIMDIGGAREPGIGRIIEAGVRFRVGGATAGSVWTLDTPFGQFTATADDVGRFDEVFGAVNPAVPPDFAGLNGADQPIQTFLRAAFDPAANPTLPLGFIGDGITEMVMDGGVTITVNGPDLAAPFTTNQAAIMGKIFNEPGATVTLVGNGANKTLEADIGGNIEPVVGGVKFPGGPSPVALGAKVPPRVAVTDGVSAVVTMPVDTVTITAANINAKGVLTVKAKSNMTPAPKLTVFDADTGLQLKRIAAGIARIPNATATNIEVRSAQGGTATAAVNGPAAP